MAPLTFILTFPLLVVYGTWILLRRLFSILDNVPGPRRKSFITGTGPRSYCLSFSPVRIGNLTQYHDPDAWEFQRELEEDYGQVVKVHGPFAVREARLPSRRGH